MHILQAVSDLELHAAVPAQLAVLDIMLMVRSRDEKLTMLAMILDVAAHTEQLTHKQDLLCLGRVCSCSNMLVVFSAGFPQLQPPNTKVQMSRCRVQC